MTEKLPETPAMNRRDFLQYATTSSALALAGVSLIGQEAEATQTSVAFTAASNFALAEMTIADLQAGMTSGQYTARDITAMYIARIEAIDQSGSSTAPEASPALKSVIEINPDALDIAARLDEERRKTGPRSLLHGIPVLLKDNIDTADKMQTTAGSLALVGTPAKHDAFLVQRLRAAGAVILGKTNLSEWANFRSERSSSGWSGRGGQTRNPYALDRNPCGSSSGSGVAVAANLCAVAVGTETDGSIICPSTHNSIVGIKPTLGLISRAGIIPIAHSQDTAGPMARTVADAAILLGAMVGIDPADSLTAESRGKAHTDYHPFLDPQGLKNARIGVARNYFGFHERVDAIMEDAIKVMKERGAIMIDPINLSEKELGEPEYEVLLYEFKTNLNAYLTTRFPDGIASSDAERPIRTLQDVIEYNERHRETEMPYFGQEIFLKAQQKGPLTSPEYLKALQTAKQLATEKGIDAVLREHKLDAIIAPSGGPAWVTDLVTGDHFLGGSSSLAAVAGYPNITVPAGYVYGLPIGISFFGGAYSEPTLIKIAGAYEQSTNVRRPPEFLTTAKLNW